MLRFTSLTSLVLIATLCGVSDATEPVLVCAQVPFAAATHGGEEELLNNEETSSEPSVVECAASSNHCYAFWKEDPINGTIVIMGQGCWEISGKPEECEQEQCVSVKKPPRAMNTTKFCCCAGNMCNVNVSDGYVPGNEEAAPATEILPKPTPNPLIWAIVGSAVTVGIVAVGIFVYAYRRSSYPNKSDVENGSAPMPPLGNYSLEHIKMCNVIGEGRYGCVWRGLIDDQEIAVKVFPAHHRTYFLNERELYSVAAESPALLKCLGGGERCLSPGGPTDYLLILTYEPLGCLQDYLRANVINLATISRMALGVARGLAHLHSDLGKPCITHRDVNSRNVLVKADLSCCLCDLGLAVQPRSAESRSLSEAGTLRYMAPEVLEGAVNLRDCESALKQIDVYALGLVIWELGARCTDLQNGDPQPYSLPFQKEAGPHPTLEQMQGLVSRHKARPLWPISWKDSPPARLLCETAEDCWDQDAEARLTALCVEERFLELPSLRGGGRVLHSLHPPASPTPLINNNHLHDTLEASVGTIETLLSPSEEQHCAKNSNQTAACVTPLQPYQGRNPCLERNLLSGSSDSLLVDKSSKHCYNLESQSLMANDYLGLSVGPHRGATPIPYLQNAVHGSPKQYNNVAAKPKFRWAAGFRKLFKKATTSSVAEVCDDDNYDEPRSNLVTEIGLCKDTQVRLVPGKLVNGFGGGGGNNGGVTTSLLNETAKRPSTLPLVNVKAAANAVETSSPPPSADSTAGVSQIMRRRKNSLNRQRSLEQFAEVFSSISDLSRLKDPSQRVKTPGDVPPSVRRTRGKAAIDSARFSLYDDRMMTGQAQWGSAPDLEPQATAPLKPPQINDLQDRDSVSSF